LHWERVSILLLFKRAQQGKAVKATSWGTFRKKAGEAGEYYRLPDTRH